MYRAEAIQVPVQRQEASAAKFYAGRNIASRIIDLRQAIDIGDDALIEQAQHAVEAKLVEEIITSKEQ
ncbi:MAG TPA: hypothetical protein VFI84_00885 [Candidatus Saccharimonadales bacterium]|nr:hypothetical protein [Candidatus Saccharimonadales bacterium]